MRLVLDLTEGLRCHNVTCDNFFTCYQLGQQFLKRKITMVERDVFSSKFVFTPTTTLVSYLPKKNKNVVLLSTLHKDGSISDRVDRKPIIIMDYNRNKGGVDNLDMRSIRPGCLTKATKVFLEQLGKALVAPLIERRKNVPQTEASAQIVKAFQSAGLLDRPDDQASTSTFKTSKRKRCQFCPKE
ncbi:unnamed protein product [Lepeophtheirus salmonis]|uniref:(salmon louse) hypothetical protein n=1 Tax=Lepeophtheirus salmonis TaxID=72036 RepID=A0A7R8CET2_LEPSM|nr:unnamed protein product [Lepeophtheirus salmonis]CAF2798583.1 unnamed protein product [Lepeophtheirus salmonis]